MLIAGSDVSGDEDNGQTRYIAFVIGNEEDINSLHNDIGINEIHMVRLDEKEKKHVIKTLDFKKYNIRAWCFHVGRQRTIDAIYNHQKLLPKNKRKDKIHQAFDYHLLHYFKDKLEDLTYNAGIGLADLVVQGEGDMKLTIENWKMKYSRKGNAYEFSDAVAWCNEHRKKLKGCQEMDLKDTIYEQMQYDLLK
ncbi:MAG: hypothetical protein WD033_06130 [Nitrosopumilaceae archaeon]